jgi:hypothetical protein
LLLCDPQSAVNGDQRFEPTELFGEAVRPTEGFCGERRQVIDVMWLSLAEQGLQQRVRENARVEDIFETVYRLLAACVLVEGWHSEGRYFR